MRRGIALLGVLLSIALVAGCSRSDDVRVAFSASPLEPRADDKLTIRYDPEASRSPLARSESVLFRFTLIGPGGEFHTDALPMECKRGRWKVRLRPGDLLRPSPVVMLCSFVDADDPEVCDANGGDPWVLRFFEGERPVAGAEYQLYRLCNGDIRLPRNLGVPTDGGRGLRGLATELAAHPDYLPARAARWRGALEEVQGDSALHDSVAVAIRGELDGVFDLTLRSAQPDTVVAPLVSLYQEIGAASRGDSLVAEGRRRFPGSRFASICAYEWAYAPDDLEPAQDRLEGILRDDPDSPEAKKARAFLFMIYDNVLQMPEKAGALVGNGESIDRSFLERYTNILIDAGDLPGAETVIRGCLQDAESDTWQGAGLLTPMEWQQEREEEVRRDRVLLAWILAERKAYEEAAALLEPIVETMARAGDRVGLANLAECQDSLGRQTDALVTYSRLAESARPTDETKAAWRRTYAEVHGSDEGFDDQLAMLDGKRKDNQWRGLERRSLDWPAPDVTLSDLAGTQRALSDFRGKVVFLDFWATWCGPCLASLPNVEQLYQSLGDGGEIAVIALNTWERGTLEERRAAIEEKWGELGLSLPAYLDGDSSGDEKSAAADLFRVPSIPCSFIIGRDGRILFREGGLFDEGDMEDLLLKIDFALSRQVPTAS